MSDQIKEGHTKSLKSRFKAARQAHLDKAQPKAVFVRDLIPGTLARYVNEAPRDLRSRRKRTTKEHDGKV